MQLTGNTILITGGATGIGLALAQRFLAAGSEVIVCGRRANVLAEAKSKHPALHTITADVETETGRRALFQQVAQQFPRLNVLVNNAGIQIWAKALEEKDWDKYRQEIIVNVDAPIHLSLMFLPLLQRQPRPVIVNVTSGLAFAPLTVVPIYCATKAAMHSFTLTLRYHLRNTPIQVIEVMPPAVNTDLGGPNLHLHGVPVDEFADAVMAGLERGDLEVAYGYAEDARKASREQLDELFRRMNSRY